MDRVGGTGVAAARSLLAALKDSKRRAAPPSASWSSPPPNAPSSDVILTSLRDLFAWRFAGRCTTDIVLGHGWAARGWSANTIPTSNQGAGLLIADRAAWTQGQGG